MSRNQKGVVLKERQQQLSNTKSTRFSSIWQQKN